MKTTLLKLALLASLPASTYAVGSDLILECGPMPLSDIESIEVRNLPLGQITSHYRDGSKVIQNLNSEIEIELEVFLPLPNDGAVERGLQWRHTGWKVVQFIGGAAVREDVECR